MDKKQNKVKTLVGIVIGVGTIIGVIANIKRVNDSIKDIGNEVKLRRNTKRIRIVK